MNEIGMGILICIMIVLSLPIVFVLGILIECILIAFTYSPGGSKKALYIFTGLVILVSIASVMLVDPSSVGLPMIWIVVAFTYLLIFIGGLLLPLLIDTDAVYKTLSTYSD